MEKKPEGAEIWIDHALVGYIPSTFKLKAVKHTFVVKDHVHADWIRQIYVLKDSEVTLQPDLQ
jgi:hypothetical protein